MEDVHCYPLIRIGKSGSEYRAATPAEQEHNLLCNHRLWLTELAPNCYRLGASYTPSNYALRRLRLHCPQCNEELETVTLTSIERELVLYVCDNCVKRFWTGKGGLNLCDNPEGQRPGAFCAKKAKSEG